MLCYTLDLHSRQKHLKYLTTHKVSKHLPVLTFSEFLAL